MKTIKKHFYFEEDITYLNHGSFGACPKVIFEDYQNWQIKLENQPVQFLTNELYDALRKSRESLSAFLGVIMTKYCFFKIRPQLFQT